MKKGLQEINELPGVWGSLLCSNQGEIIQKLVPPALNKAILENISRNLLEMMNRMADELEGLNEVILHYEQRKVIAVDIQKALLVVVCTPSVDIPLLRMSTNVILARWEGDLKIQKKLNNLFVERL